MIIHFIRHGETTYHTLTKDFVIWEAKDASLTSNWINKAIELGRRFLNDNTTFDCVISSSTPRAVETAKYIFPEIDIMITDKLRAKSSGDWEWKLKSEVFTEEYLHNIYDFIPPWGESYSMVSERSLGWFYDFVKNNYDKNKVAVISHDFAIKCLFCHFFQVPGKLIEKLKINNLWQMIIELDINWWIKLLHWN